MVREINRDKKKKKSKGLTKDKDYISEAWLQGGKAVGKMVKPKKKKKQKTQK